MQKSFLKKLKFLFILVLLFSFKVSSAQVKYDAISFRIDSLAAMGLPKSALAEVDKLEKLARENNNTPEQIRAVVYRMTFESYLEQDALTAIISRLKLDIAQSAYPVKPVLQSLLGEMYWKYYQQYRYQYARRSRLLKPDTDFTKWDLQTIINETSHQYKLSLHDAERAQMTPISVLDGVLAGDSSTRYLRPTLYDLLLQRALSFYLEDEPALTRPKLPFSPNNPALFADNRTFADLQIKTTDTASTYYLGLKLLQQGTAFHLKMNQPEAVADLDMQRLKFLFGKSHAEHKDSLYLAALRGIASSFAQKPISSEALVLQGQYYQGLDSLITAHSYYKQALTAYPESQGGQNAATLIREIEVKEIAATIDEVNAPGKPLLALLNYRNITQANFTVYHLSESQLAGYLAGYKSYYTKDTRLDFLKKFKPVQSHELKLVDLKDFRKHSAEFKIDALPPGNYVLLVRENVASDETQTGLANFRVSRIAYTARENPDEKTEIRVMDRETGAPLSGVKILLSGKRNRYDSNYKTSYTEDIVDNGTSDKNGFFITCKFGGNNQMSIGLRIKGDTLNEGQRYIAGAMDNSDDDDDPEDKTILFTDRQIYRPGQTIYFKGLQLQTFKGKSKILPGKTLTVDFLDVNNKQVSSVTLKTNDFGTLNGSFIIPQNMLDGNITIKTVVGEISVKVEEYKRPTFQVAFLPLKESNKLNDSVTIRGTVMAFSGYGLSHAKVAYHITRSENFDYYNYNRHAHTSRYNYNRQTAEIKTDTTTTDDQGNYIIKFKAIPGEADKAYVINYRYDITADVTDASGETHTGETAVNVGNNDIKIIGYLPTQLLAKDSIRLPFSINNLNGQEQKGDIKVEVYALQNPGQLFKSKLWSKPDMYLLSKTDFKDDFHEYAYSDEDEASTWKRLNKIEDLGFKVDENKPGVLKLDELRQQPSGIYQVIIRAKNEKGDTTSTTSYVDLVNEASKPANVTDWVIPVVNEVKPGEKAEFRIGFDQKINVLMERYNGAKLISSKWLIVDEEQQKIKIPVSDTDKDVAVQFMAVYQNRIYNSYQKIYKSNPDENLKIRFLTFQNKLQPGEKEQWKLQITDQNNEKQAAEMVAALYDASLDDITPAQNWREALDNPERNEPNYFAWNSYDFIHPVNTEVVENAFYDFSLLNRDYESLYLFGYSYYGGYNAGYQQYLKTIKTHQDSKKNDARLETDYTTNAQKIKDGFLVSGKILAKDDGLPIPGATIKIKGMGISTLSNSGGFFKIKVPANATLVISFIGYTTKEIAITKVENFSIMLESSSSLLGEVVVTGYGVQKKKDITGSVATITLRGNRSMLVGSAKQLNVTTAENMLQGQAAGVTIVQGAPGAGEKVLIRGIADFKSIPITIRKNFNETAFFYPQLHTDSSGKILIDFTIPEALTKWRFKAFAHTKDLKSGYIENTVVTQKQLSISANMPRFMREGDTITVSARLANLTGDNLKGEVTLQLFNALNMQPVSLLRDPAEAKQKFEVAALTNHAVSFKLVIPQNLDALTYRLTADAGTYSDGEENTLPVLPNRMLVTESMPMMIRAGQDRTFTFDKLLNNTSTTLKSKSLTLEYTQNPAWYAVQALPYMMEFPYECSEQVFSRYYANSLATNLVNHMPVIKQVFDQWKSSNSAELLSNLEKNQELKYTLLEETPWLRDATNETEQKKRIALLFDLNKMSSEMQQNLDKLQQRQLPDGGFTWFAGDRADRYITQHIVEGIGQLCHLHIPADGSGQLRVIADKAVGYLDGKLIADDREARKFKGYEARGIYATEIHAWYARSFYPDQKISGDLKKVFANYLARAEKGWLSQNVYEQGMIALTMLRNGKPLVANAIIKSLKETAQQSDDLGMYWGKNMRGYFWYESPIETQSLLIALFTEAGGNEKAVEEMKIWLLRNKQTSDWKTTKATAAACYALLMKQDDWLSPDNTSEIKLGEKELTELKPDIKADAGSGYIKTTWADDQVKKDMGKVKIKNNGKSISWGAMHWQYLEQLDKITPSKTDIQLERKYFILKQTDSGPVVTAVDAQHQPKTGDLLKVIVYLKAGRDFEYVQLKDMRPAGTEPVSVLSEYKYQDGLWYYEVTKDVATNFFISYLNKGNYVFEYQLRVAQPGDFSTGITTIQCMYAPEFNAHSEGQRVVFKP